MCAQLQKFTHTHAAKRQTLRKINCKKRKSRENISAIFQRTPRRYLFITKSIRGPALLLKLDLGHLIRLFLRGE